MGHALSKSTSQTCRPYSSYETPKSPAQIANSSYLAPRLCLGFFPGPFFGEWAISQVCIFLGPGETRNNYLWRKFMELEHMGQGVHTRVQKTTCVMR